MEFNFVHKKRLSDAELYLGPLTKDDIITEFGDEAPKLAHLMALTPVFKSVSDARKNGWDASVPPGYSEFVVGKMKHKIYILK